MKIEEWRQVPTCPMYEVSSFGRLRRDGRFLKPSVCGKKGRYLKFTMWVDGKRTDKSLHVLVTECFHGLKPEPHLQVCHWNGDGHDCHADNLRWGTQEDNMADMERHGRLWRGGGARGENHYKAKLTAANVQEIRALAPSKGLFTQLSARYGVNRSTISRVFKGEFWKAS